MSVQAKWYSISKEITNKVILLHSLSVNTNNNNSKYKHTRVQGVPPAAQQPLHDEVNVRPHPGVRVPPQLHYVCNPEDEGANRATTTSTKKNKSIKSESLLAPLFVGRVHNKKT